jgi:hypothetical protein
LARHAWNLQTVYNRAETGGLIQVKEPGPSALRSRPDVQKISVKKSRIIR